MLLLLSGLFSLIPDDYYDRRTVEYLVAPKYAVDLVATSVIEVRDFQSDDFIGSLTGHRFFEIRSLYSFEGDVFMEI